MTKDDWNRRCVFLEEVDSTNRFALELVRSDRPPSGTIVVTDFQTEGRGQRGKTWSADRGVNALFTYIAYPSGIRPTENFKLNKMVSVAVWRGIRDHLQDPELYLKWPNDLYVGDRKTGGLLIQNVLKGHRIDHCVIGIGLNVNQEGFPADLPKATSLRIASGAQLDIPEVIRSVSRRLDEALNKMDWPDIDHTYTSNLYLKNKMARFRIEGKMVDGIITGVNAEGQLLVRIDGAERKFSFGEISYG